MTINFLADRKISSCHLLHTEYLLFKQQTGRSSIIKSYRWEHLSLGKLSDCAKATHYFSPPNIILNPREAHEGKHTKCSLLNLDTERDLWNPQTEQYGERIITAKCCLCFFPISSPRLGHHYTTSITISLICLFLYHLKKNLVCMPLFSFIQCSTHMIHSCLIPGLFFCYFHTVVHVEIYHLLIQSLFMNHWVVSSFGLLWTRLFMVDKAIFPSEWLGLRIDKYLTCGDTAREASKVTGLIYSLPSNGTLVTKSWLLHILTNIWFWSVFLILVILVSVWYLHTHTHTHIFLYCGSSSFLVAMYYSLT